MTPAQHRADNASTSSHPRRSRDAVAALFAAALDGDTYAENELRRLALHSDRAGDALAAVGYSRGLSASRRPEPSPAEVAATDQLIAAVLAAVAAPR